MDREAAVKQMKSMKTKAKAARKGDKRNLAGDFRRAAKRLARQLRATAPRVAKKAEEAKA